MRHLVRSLAAASLAAAVSPAHAAYQDYDQFTAPTGAAQMAYAPAFDKLLVRNSASAVAVVDIPTRLSQTHLANYRFNDMSLAPSGRYLFVADYGGENIGYGSPLNQSYVHRLDLANRVWDQKLAYIAGNVQAVSDTQLILKSLDQWVTFTNNSWGAGLALTVLNSSTNSFFAPGYYAIMYSGDFRWDAKNKRLLHGNSGISSPEVNVFKLSSAGDFVPQEGTGIYGTAYTNGGGGTTTLATDSSVFYYGRMQVEALDVAHYLRTFPEAIYAANASYAFGNGKLYDAHTGDLLFILPFNTTVYALDPQGSDFWAFDAATNTVHHFAEAPAIAGPGAVDFGGTGIGTTSLPFVVTIRNITADPVTVTGVNVPAGFDVVSNTCGALAGYAACAITLTASPATLGPVSGSLVASFSSGASTTIALTALGQDSAVVSPAAVDFGGTGIGTISLPATITVENISANPMTVTSVAASAGFDIVSNDCGTVAGNGTCTVMLTASPAVAGLISGSLVVSHTGGSPRTVPLAALGQVSAAVTPSHFDFGGTTINSTSPPVAVSIRNISANPMTVTSAIASAGFNVVSNTCGTVAGNATCTITVTARPATLGPMAGSLVVNHSGGGPTTVPLAVFGQPDSHLSNISTRLAVLTGEDVAIAGFVISGAADKTVAIVATGPSLAAAGIPNALVNPTLTVVRQSDGAVLAVNDDWQADANAARLQAAGFAPHDPREPAVLLTLPPGAYTAIVSGVGGATGVGLPAVYEVDHFDTPLINISTRGRVLAGTGVMIAGFIVQGDAAKTVVVVGTGPSLAQAGVASPLANPRLTLVRQSDQAVIATNDDWQGGPDAAAISAAGLAPAHVLESAIMATLPPGAYTAVLEGVGGGTGVGLLAIYAR